MWASYQVRCMENINYERNMAEDGRDNRKMRYHKGKLPEIKTGKKNIYNGNNFMYERIHKIQ